MTTKGKILTLAGYTAALLAANGQPMPTATAAAPAGLSPLEQRLQELKNPAPWMSWGGDLRLRNEYFDNLLTLNPNVRLHEQDHFRFRGRIWTALTPFEDLTLSARLADEAREWLKPAGYSPLKGSVGPDYAEGLIDNLNLQWRKIAGLPATLTVGRQDIFLGDGWLTGDGTPADGSWTYFLDAARFTYELKDQHTTIEAIGIMQDARDDGWLPPLDFNNQDRFLTEQNEKGAILSIANTSLRAANLTGYFIYKHDDRANPGGINPVPRGGDNADIYTFGGRLSGLVADHWKYAAEGAYQFGRKADIDIKDAFSPAGGSAEYRNLNACGFNGRLTYLCNDSLNSQANFSYEFLSGDNPNSRSDEMFDVLWGRWPRWSEIGLYGYAAETRIGQESNLHRIGPGWSFTPMKNLDLSANYFALFSDEDAATRGVSGLFTGTGNFRGHFVQGILKYKFSRHVSGHLWSEFLFPGDYYANNKPISFLRAEIMLTF
jgi:Alginate export